MITFHCHCGKTHYFTDELAGRTTPCQQCGQSIMVPYLSAPEQISNPSSRPVKLQPGVLVGVLIAVFLAIASVTFARMEREQKIAAITRAEEMKHQVETLQKNVRGMQNQLAAALEQISDLKHETDKRPVDILQRTVHEMRAELNAALKQIAEWKVETRDHQADHQRESDGENHTENHTQTHADSAAIFDSKIETLEDPIDLDKAPSDFRQMMEKIKKEIKEQGGFAVAGQVVDENDTPFPMREFTAALRLNSANANDTHRFDNGWFITRRQTRNDYNKLVATTFYHQEQEIPLTIENGKIIQQKVQLESTPPERLMDFKGTITNEDRRPISNAHVVLRLSRCNSSFSPPLTREAKLDSRGKYLFSKITPQKYFFSVSARSYKGIYATLEANEDKTGLVVGSYSISKLLPQIDSSTINVVLSYPRRVTMDIVYQPDGSTDFTKNNVKKGKFTLFTAGSNDQVNWSRRVGYYVRLDSNTDLKYGHDFYLNFHDDHVIFDTNYGGPNGCYDLGQVDFESVSKADPDKIERFKKQPCQKGHVYVMRTLKDWKTGNYAKIAIRDIKVIK